MKRCLAIILTLTMIFSFAACGKGVAETVCKNCNKEISSESLFCLYCGTAVNMVCPSCNKAISADSKFCSHCGADVVGEEATPNEDVQPSEDVEVEPTPEMTPEPTLEATPTPEPTATPTPTPTSTPTPTPTPEPTPEPTPTPTPSPKPTPTPTPTPTPSPKTSLNAEEIYEKCASAVFYIEVYDRSGTVIGSGSGVFISADGKALTNHHVIEDAYSVKIMTNDGNVYDVTGYYDAQNAIDMAMIQVNGKGFPYLTMGDSTKITAGQTVFAIGSPRGLDDTISQGIISNVNRVLDGMGYIQMTAPISPGSSGGALINDRGLLIGLNTAFYKDSQNINLAVPIHRYKELAVGALHSFPINGVPEYSGASLEFNDSLNITVGETGIVTISVDPGNCTEDVTIQWDCANENIASPEWDEWDEWDIDLLVQGNSEGSITITLTLLTEGDEVLVEESLFVTVSAPSSTSVAYRKLAGWVLDNASNVYDERCAFYDESPEGDLFGISYYYEEGSLTVSQLTVSEQSTVWAAFSIYPNTSLLDCYVNYEWNETGETLCEMYGKVDASTYNYGKPLRYTYYSGDQSMESLFSEVYETCIATNIEWLRILLDATALDITLVDLGFTSYK